MTSFLASFSDPFMLALVVWPFASMLLTLPVVALLYHRDNALRFSAVLTAYLVVLYLLGLACFTLYPLPADPEAFCAAHHLQPQLNPFEFVSDITSAGLTAILQIVMNVVFFLPLGFFMGRTFRWKIWLALPFGLLTSLLIETAQLTGIFGLYPCSYRLFDVDDLIWNMAGAAIGYLLAMIVNRVFPVTVLEDDAITTSPGFIRRTVAFIIDNLLTVVAAMPFSMAVWLVEADMGVQQLRLQGVSVQALIFAVMFFLFEAVVPFLRGGLTLGGGFLRMSVETKPREGVKRLAFYALRFLSLYVVTATGSLGAIAPAPQLWILFLLLFWVVKKQMPYDLLP